MATRSTSMFIEDTALCAGLNQPLQTCPEVLSAIYAAHYRHVLQVCRHFFRQREDAEDAAAEIFLKLHRVLETRNEAVPFRPWVSQVACRHCIDKLRRRKREKDSCVDGADLSEVPDNSTPSPLSEVLRREKGLEVREQLIRLPKKYKVPLVLRYYKQMSYSEIAHALKRRLSAVRMMIFRGKEQLRHNLQREQSGKNQPTRYRATRPLRELGDMMGPLVVGEPKAHEMIRQERGNWKLPIVGNGRVISFGIHVGPKWAWRSDTPGHFTSVVPGK